MGSLGISEVNITGRGRKKKNKNQNMLLTTTAGGQVAQTLASAISEWEASSVLRVRTRHECPEDNLRELM